MSDWKANCEKELVGGRAGSRVDGPPGSATVGAER